MSESPTKTKKELDDYTIIGTIGKGAYGQVSLVKRDGKLYAMKQILKKKLALQKKEYQAFVEKQLLRKMEHPGIIKLVKCFQDPKKLYYVLDYCHGGSFINFIRLYNDQLTDDIKKFYVAEIVSVLEYLHGQGITHRDLKPENIMLSKDGHLRLIDFGTAEITRCKLVDEQFKENITKQKKQSSPSIIQDITQDQQDCSPRKRKSTFVGTSYYISPELLIDNICEAPSDLWGLGCVIYQLYYLDPPFKGPHEYDVFQKIKNVDIHYPKNNKISDDVVDLIKRLIIKDPSQRLGSDTREGLMFADLKKHPFFSGINFENIFQQQVPEIKQEQIHKQEYTHRMEKIEEQIKTEYEDRLKKDNVVFHGIVQKKSFTIYTLAYFILEDNFKMYEIQPYAPYDIKVLEMETIGEGKAAEIIQGNRFKMIGDETILKLRSSKAADWVSAINKSYENRG